MARDHYDAMMQERLDAGLTAADLYTSDVFPTEIIEMRVTDLLDLTGKRAVVTGAGGRGHGQAAANRLAGLGADVALVDIDADGLRSVSETVRSRWGTEVLPIVGDTTDWDDIHRVMAQVHDELGGIDILVNNAVEVSGGGELRQLSKEQIDRTIHGVLTGPLYCSRAALEHMVPQRSGRIINVASEAGIVGIADLVLYGTCKAGLIALTRFLGKEVAQHGVQVLGVAPGVMAQPDSPSYPGAKGQVDCLARTPMGRPELHEEVANMTAFLASDAAAYMCGTTIEMGGGMAI